MSYYEKVLGAVEIYHLTADDGSIAHAEMKLGDATIFLSEENAEIGCLGPQSLGGCATTLRIFVPDVDDVYARAIAAGGKALSPVQGQPWGDRVGSVEDPFGYRWNLTTHVEDVSPEEIQRRLAASGMH